MNHPARYVSGDPDHDRHAARLRIVSAAVEVGANIATTSNIVIIEGTQEQLTKLLLLVPGPLTRSVTWGRLRHSLRWEAPYV